MIPSPGTARFVGRGLLAAMLVAVVGTVSAAENAAPIPIAADGKPAATIVVSSEPSAEAWFAAAELRDHLRKMTDAEIPIVTDAVDVAGPRLLVGESRLTRDLGLSNDDFEPQEYLIGFRPETLVLMGRDARSPVQERRLTLHGKAVYTDGQSGKSLQFGTGLDALALRSHGMRDEAGTFEAWVWIDSKEPGTLFRVDGGNPWSYLMVMTQDNAIRFTAYGGENAPGGSVVSQPVTPGEWHQVTAVYDAGKGLMKLFVDGTSQGTAPYAAATAATSAGHVSIGAYVTHRNDIANKFVGRMDGIKLSSRARSPSKSPTTTADTLLFLDCDDEAEQPTDSVAYVMPPGPAFYTPQATCYAVYDFLERFCGVRWYAPSDDGCVIPRVATLTIEGADVRRRPAMEFRSAPPSLRDQSWGLVAREAIKPGDVERFMRRMRLGGRNFYTMHSFVDYYDRYWSRNPKRPELFEERRAEYFAKGYGDKNPPPQLCYTSDDLVARVVQDARAKFDSGAEMFDIVPMDNDSHCRCPKCRSLLDMEDNDGFFSSGRASDLIFGFINRVAAELRKTHPDRFVGALAYYDYARFPKHIESLEPNILVGPCLSVRNWWCPPMKANDLDFYRQWVRRTPGRIHCLIIYQCFPGDAAGNRFKFFPGFHAHMLADAMRMFHEDGVRGIWLCGIAEYIDGYLTCRMMDDPTLEVDAVLDEFFPLYYGAAAGPMRKIHDLIEQTYSDPANYPPSILEPSSYVDRKTGERHFHQTKEMAWQWLGTRERIDRITTLMAQAKAAPLSAAERRRVDAFDAVAYRHLLDGRAAADR